MKLSVVIPARNEEGAVEETLSALLRTLRAEAIPCEIIVVDDGSTDKTACVVQALSVRYSGDSPGPEYGPTRLRHGRPVWAARGDWRGGRHRDGGRLRQS